MVSCPLLQILYGILYLQVLLVTELMQGGDLRTRIRNDTTVPRKTSWYQNGRYIALGTARGLVYLHSRGIIWFDCKPNNVLLDHTGTVAKIADFGLAKVLATTHTVGCLVSPDTCLPLLTRARVVFLRYWQCGQGCRLGTGAGHHAHRWLPGDAPDTPTPPCSRPALRLHWLPDTCMSVYRGRH